MTAPDDDTAAAGPRRPPAAPDQGATVTRLGPGPGEPAPAPVGAAPEVDGSLALQVPPEHRTRGLSETPELRLVTGTRPGVDEMQVWAARFAQAVVEVLGGDRPLPQLVRWTSQRVYLELERRLRLLGCSSDAGRRRRTIRPQVRSVHVFHPTPESGEVSVHVRYGERSRRSPRGSS